MVELNPAPNTLGFLSPAIGPWFGDGGSGQALPTLAVPNADLSVSVNIPNNMEWLAPTACLRTLVVATATRPPVLASLRQANGNAAFTTNNLVVLLTLTPEAEDRLWRLSAALPVPHDANIPDADDLDVNDVGLRPRIRHLALEIPAASAATMAALNNLFKSDLAAITGAADQADFLGLNNPPTSNDDNADSKPVGAFKRPGGDLSVCLKNETGNAISPFLWAFDYLGRPIDPGAVAIWWTYLARDAQWDNLWATDDVDEDERVTCAATAQNTVHIVNAHEGPIGAGLLARLNLTDLTLINNATALYSTGTAPAIAMTTAPDPDDAPVPRLAALPSGEYADPADATPFAGWTDNNWPADITRDFLRIGVTDLEQFLTGQSRSNPLQADMNSRVSALRNTAVDPVLLTVDDVTAAALDILRDGDDAVLMAPALHPLWGETRAPVSFGTDPLPDLLTFTVEALAGAGTADTGTSENQLVIVEFSGESLPVGGFIRAWPHVLDDESGIHSRADGGGGVIRADGTASLVMAIPDGLNGSWMSLDIQITTDDGSRLFSNEFYERPAALNGTSLLALAINGDAPVGGTLEICETGEIFTRGMGTYRSGQTLIFRPSTASDPTVLVDRTTLLAADVVDASLINSVTTGDMLITTEPAFTAGWDDGQTAASNGEDFLRRTRLNLMTFTQTGAPVPGQERRELIALSRQDNGGTLEGRAVISALQGRPEIHETEFAQMGHPGLPAFAEHHTVGIRLEGPSTDALVDLMIERRSADSEVFWNTANVARETIDDPGGTTCWTAVLETTARGMTGDGAMGVIADLTNLDFSSYVERVAAVEDTIGENPLDWVGDADALTELSHRIDNMLRKTANGVQDFLNALISAIGRAEDFIYIETPAMDPFGLGNNAFSVVNAIVQRLGQRAGLKIILCIPEYLDPALNRLPRMEQIRRDGIRGAVNFLVTQANGRVAAYHPKAGVGRGVHLTTTTVIIDDAILLSGGAHLWRRGLTFDSALSVALFDEETVNGRPATVQAARLDLMGLSLGLGRNLVPLDPADCFDAILSLISKRGLARIDVGAFSGAFDAPEALEHDVWNPDGLADLTERWAAHLSALFGNGDAQDFQNALANP